MTVRLLLLKVLGPAVLLLTASACGRDEPEPPPEPQPAPDYYGPASPPAPPPLPERAACAGLTVGPGDYDWSVTHGGRTRLYRVHVPPGYDATRPTPAVLSFHGYGSNELEQEGLSELSRLADLEGFLAVYPRGLNQPEATGQAETPQNTDTRGWNAGGCCGAPQVVRTDDVGFVDTLLADLDTRVCVDTRRVYATGLSTGAFFSYRLACERSGQFAAIAPVAGMEGFAPCSPERPVAVQHFHGTSDRVIYFEGGNNIPFGGPYPSAIESVSRWAQRNVCTGPTETTYDQGDSTCRTSTGCLQGASVTLCTVQGGDHTWPGGLIPPELGYTTQDLDATREMWRFFSAHPRP